MAATSQRMRIRRISLEKLRTKESTTGGAVDDRTDAAEINKSRWFVCPTTTPLYYAPVYGELGHEQRLRYNQLTAILFNELISFFETEFATSVCATLAASNNAGDCELTACLREFIAEEQQHVRWWSQLSKLSEPDRYRESCPMIFCVPRAMRALLRYLTRRPERFPAVFWIMLALEERSLDISRRCLRMDPNEMEPHYLAAYRDHMKDEVRHVHIDWHLIDRYYAHRSQAVRRLNSRLVLAAIKRFFLPPNRSAVRVVRMLGREDPGLRPLQSKMENQLRQLGTNRDYQEMMYSREATPITFKLFDRFPEMHRAGQFLQSYFPEPV